MNTSKEFNINEFIKRLRTADLKDITLGEIKAALDKCSTTDNFYEARWIKDELKERLNLNK